MVRFHPVLLAFLVLCGVLGCESVDPPNEGSWLRNQEGANADKNTGAQHPLSDPKDLRELLPRFERGEPYTWGRQTLLIPGYASGVVIDRKTSKALATVILFDRGQEPESVLSLRSLKETRYGVPFERVQRGLIRLFVLDRFEVTVQSRSSILAGPDVLEDIARRVRIKSFSKHWAKVQKAAKAQEAQDLPAP